MWINILSEQKRLAPKFLRSRVILSMEIGVTVPKIRKVINGISLRNRVSQHEAALYKRLVGSVLTGVFLHPPETMSCALSKPALSHQKTALPPTFPRVCESTLGYRQVV